MHIKKMKLKRRIKKFFLVFLIFLSILIALVLFVSFTVFRVSTDYQELDEAPAQIEVPDNLYLL